MGGLFRGMLAGASASGAGYLNGLATQPVAVWSLQKLISTATLAVRVRRSSDNAEQDIGFTGDALDTTALAAFVGANSAYVVTWYDQTGNGYHFTQATASAQPRIVNAGVYDDRLVFDGTDFMSTGTVTLGTPRVWVFTEWEQATNSSPKMLLELSADYGAAPDRFAIYDYSTQGGIVASMGQVGSGNQRAQFFANAAGMAQWTYMLDRSLAVNAEINGWRNGTTPFSGSVGGAFNEQSGTFGNHALHLGARSGGTLGSTAKDRSLVIYKDDVTSLRTAIEAIVGP